SDLAPYATHPLASRGRLIAEDECNTRSVFQRDRDRIIHSTAFRMLEYKTQVFVNHEGDYYRTRLTHSLEVAQISRSVCRQLRLNEDLGEALALAHDLGHTPFGHAGEDALDEMMQPFGGFDHNAQTLRIVTQLEKRYANFDGLNLTWETLEGVAKHNGPLLKKAEDFSILPRAMQDYARTHDLELTEHAGLEAQIASLADDIAYNNHDVDDGLRAGLFTLEDIRSVPFIARVFEEVETTYPKLHEQSRFVHEAVRRLIRLMVADLTRTTAANIAASGVETVEDVRRLGRPLAEFSAEMMENNRQLKAFLMRHMYRHYKVNRMTSKARRVVREMFALFISEPECLPEEWRRQVDAKGSQKCAVIVADYIAGMTDRYAMQEHGRLFDLSATNV
ncbi:MAG: deoxyguanosinetriphosphate triphosphohydrolase, partial [Alphaproteobacteria bacterium]|nr:deoxyguanosinetriphosphate triphosphohydrolase [Alphaproteobacteria bacterium]